MFPFILFFPDRLQAGVYWKNGFGRILNGNGRLELLQRMPDIVQAPSGQVHSAPAADLAGMLLRHAWLSLHPEFKLHTLLPVTPILLRLISPSIFLGRNAFQDDVEGDATGAQPSSRLAARATPVMDTLARVYCPTCTAASFRSPFGVLRINRSVCRLQ